jgi:hypothetical protein
VKDDVVEVRGVTEEALVMKARGRSKTGTGRPETQWVAAMQSVVANAAMVSPGFGVATVMCYVRPTLTARVGTRVGIVATEVRWVAKPEDDEEAEPENGGRDLPQASEEAKGEAEAIGESMVVGISKGKDGDETGPGKEENKQEAN